MAALGLPGLFDVHVHFLPPRMQAKVWAQFDSAGPLIGRPWPIRYRGAEEERVEQLRALGVRRFSALSYAHRPGMAESLNDWAADFADRVPECLRSGTFFPEPGVEDYVARRIEAGVEVFKVHVQVGAFDLRDPLLDPVWGLLAEAGTPVVVHAGSGPVPTQFTGPEPLRAVLARHPRLTAVVAHMGAPEYAEFLRLALRARADLPRHDDGVHDFFFEGGAFPADLVAGWGTGPTRCCSGRTSRTSPTPSPTSSRRWSGSSSGTSGCGRCAGRTAPRLLGEPVASRRGAP